MKTKKEITQSIEATNPHSAWGKAVKTYALELLESCEEPLTRDNLKSALLNGAENWNAYSYGGCSLIYDSDIAERLCSPSELKRCRGGARQPNGWETWLDAQARALSQAFAMISRHA